jgi:DEAD/DEAH box helicase/Helicase C-terminal domain
MAFKKTPPAPQAPDSPEKLLLDLPRRKIAGPLLHQGEIMRSYAANAVKAADVALQLPTGSGKTLVGLMIAEWRRRTFKERIVYLCPTRQLVNQVVEQAADQYGLTVNGFTGSRASYGTTAKAEYQSAARLAITTYSSLFNTNPFFEAPEVIIVDDAHAAENYIAAMWTLRIDRRDEEQKLLHGGIVGVLKPLLDVTTLNRLGGGWDDGEFWVDKLPTPAFASVQKELVTLLDEHVGGTQLRHPWSVMRGHLHACHLYLSANEFLIRPLIAPTWTHGPFADATQRIYMSATLGAGGDLERLTGRTPIKRLPVPQGWDRKGIGRRYFVFPEMSLDDTQTVEFRTQLMVMAGRSVVLVPTERAQRQVMDDVQKALGFKLFDAAAIEESKKPFVTCQQAVAVVANRYDGIDFPGDDCRVLFIEGLPKATNLQERFIMSRMGAAVLFNERVQTRILQAVGRCTRALQDYSIVVATAAELPDYLSDQRRLEFLHPELQAELSFGIEQSQQNDMDGLLDNCRIFLEHGQEWEDADQQIVAKRQSATQLPFPAIDELSAIVHSEIEYQRALWHSDFEEAAEHAGRVLGGLSAPGLRGYRALWQYLAGAASWQAADAGVKGYDIKAREHFGHAKAAAPAVPWLVGLSRYQAVELEEADDTSLFRQLEKVEGVLARLGTAHDRAFAQREKTILEGLTKNDTFDGCAARFASRLKTMLGLRRRPCSTQRKRGKSHRIQGGLRRTYLRRRMPRSCQY